ncbi:acyl carrier protein [Microbacterium trichothecenolyticum]|uniref:acyl carrier protein n=1 Tax=Microbacterium trichothecenolyticum TaxID=69370 RepID=UPI0028648B7D|nr:acyl carrier protein [Microbacterium trichothecenolyticum]MDR7185327.1 acyl carrier protein [Microbacterium trichothecenolyticum]
MDQQELIALVEEILEADAGTVAIDNDLDDLGWDSLANITFIAEIDERTGRTIGSAALAECSTVKDLWELVVPTRA